jgi:hypothetical protein
MHCSLTGGHGIPCSVLGQRAMERIEGDSWEPAEPECRALIVTAAAGSHEHFALTHPSAAFLTQLLAIKADVPQTRERRREEPEVATHVYEAGMTTPVPHTGSLLSRAM